MRRGLALAILVLAAAVLVAHAWRYRGFFIDDAFISLRYAQRFATGHGLTWVDGERVEGYSNLSWVLACAALLRAGVDGVLAARLLGHLAALAALAAVVWSFRPARLADAAPALFAALALAIALPLPAWAMGGLEAPLVAATLAWALVLTFDERALPAGVAWALLCLTRPDGALLVAAALAGLAVTGGLRAAVRIALLPAAAVAAQLAFRRLYYDAWVPNTALVKLGVTLDRVRFGAAYLWSGALGFAALVVLAAAAAAVVEPRARRRVVILGGCLVAWCAYVLVVGGDWMPAHRLLVPALVLLVLLGAEALAAASARGGDWRTRAFIAAGALLAVHVAIQASDPEAPRGQHRWVWDARAVGLTLGRAFAARQPLLAVDSAGAIAYYSELPTLDLLGLTNPVIARRPTDGHAIVGHDRGDGRYALSRQPDLVLFGGPRGGHAAFASGGQMEADPRFAADYTLVDLAIDDRLRSAIWVRKEGRLGIVRTPDAVVIPGFLFADGASAHARLDAAGAPELVLAPNGCAALAVTPPAGTSALDGSGATLEVRDGRLRLCAGPSGATVRSVRFAAR